MTQTTFPEHPFTSSHAKALGIRRARLRSALRSREVVRLLRDVYLRADIEPTVEIRAKAAALVISPHSVVCDRTAAWIWGVDCHEFRELDGYPPLETYVLSGHRATDRAEVAGGTRDLMPCDWVVVHGVRVTTPLRTAMDLGCKLSRRSALAAMDALMRARGFTTADMMHVLPRYFRRRGVIQLRELVPLVDGRAESQGESWTRLEISDHGLPTPDLQWWIVIDGVPTYRLDLAYPHARIAVEYHGEEFHTSAEDRANDAARREWLRRNGWKVIVVDKSSFTDQALAAWIAELHSHLAEAQRVPRRWYTRAGH
jgi:hypothetical protein